MTNAGYDVVVVAHALCAVVGFGALGLTGTFGALARRAARPFEHAALRRYFRPGRNGAERVILLVPVFGAILLVWQHDNVHEAFPWIGLCIWVVATGIVTAVIWPAELVLQRCYDDHGAGHLPDDPAPGGADSTAGEPLEAGARLVELRRMARRLEWSCACTSVLFVAAMIDMIGQPH